MKKDGHNVQKGLLIYDVISMMSHLKYGWKQEKMFSFRIQYSNMAGDNIRISHELGVTDEL